MRDLRKFYVEIWGNCFSKVELKSLLWEEWRVILLILLVCKMITVINKERWKKKYIFQEIAQWVSNCECLAIMKTRAWISSICVKSHVWFCVSNSALEDTGPVDTGSLLTSRSSQASLKLFYKRPCLKRIRWRATEGNIICPSLTSTCMYTCSCTIHVLICIVHTHIHIHTLKLQARSRHLRK